MHRPSAAAAVAVVVATVVACSLGPARNRLALDQPLTFDDVTDYQFVPEESGPHDVIIQFGWPIADEQVETLVTSAAATTGASGAPAFGFSWVVLHNGRPIGRRDSPQRSTGVVDTHPSGLGDGPRISRGLVFGWCELEAGRSYTLRLDVGAQLNQLAKAHPRIVVIHRPTVLSLN